MVDPNISTGAALWQGLMLIVVAVWVIWLITEQRTFEETKKSVFFLFIFGIVLLIAILAIGV